jgi:hypothetical protein
MPKVVVDVKMVCLPYSIRLTSRHSFRAQNNETECNDRSSRTNHFLDQGYDPAIMFRASRPHHGSVFGVFEKVTSFSFSWRLKLWEVNDLVAVVIGTDT